jgi:hypothetical protein
MEMNFIEIECDGENWTELVPGMSPAVGYASHGNERSGTIKVRNILTS